jgi:hypothetical protein
MSCYLLLLFANEPSSSFRYNPRAIEDLQDRMMLHVKDDLLNDAIMNLMTTSDLHLISYLDSPYPCLLLVSLGAIAILEPCAMINSKY